MSSLFKGANHAALYSKFRPSPPNSLIEQILTFMKTKIETPFQNAVDIGCGSGHSTIALAPYFQNVTGLDVSEAQIKNAKQTRFSPNIRYRVATAEKLDFADSSIDLVTAGQAVHWFDIPKFFKEVKRILIPNGAVAVYGYWIPTPVLNNAAKTKKLADLIKHYLHDDQLGKFWDQRRYDILQNYYADIHFPFNDIMRKTLVKESLSTVTDYIGYLSSWSAYENLRKEDPTKAVNLLELIQERLMEILEVTTSPEVTTMSIHTDYFLLLGNKSV